MSFMFLPIDYDDWSAINKPNLSEKDYNSFVVGNVNVMKEIAKKEAKTIHIDGYVGADFEHFVKELVVYLDKKYTLINMNEYTMSQENIDELTKECLPDASEEDPIKLFGKLYDGDLIDLYDQNKLKELKKSVNSNKKVIIFGHGSTLKDLLTKDSLIVYLDVSPKNTAVRSREKKYKNIGDYEHRQFNELMRRNYYVDFELVIKHRTELLKKHIVDYYVDANFVEKYKMFPMESLANVFNSVALQPFRCKPVYLEGIWGGEFIRKIRNLPKEMSNNIAWIFEFIPMEVSIVFDIKGEKFETPFATFLKYCGKEIMGEKAYESFNGYFPIRFNYDDTWHSDGNMSIQVHPGKDVTISKYGEHGSQDEAYYIIATGHNAKTYIGFKDDTDTQEFMELAEKSQKEELDIDYTKYVNAEESIPGKQFMIPAGTIHSSGRNQLILELGSLTIGSYTYKIYDYNRKDKNGNKRPIHLKMAKEVLKYERNGSWVRENLSVEPKLIKESNAFKEYIVGDCDKMYFQTARIELITKGLYVGNNKNQFTTITVVDGESIVVYDKKHPNRKYNLNFLEIATIPSTIEEYVIENTGYQPVVVHKAYLKNNFEQFI